MSSHSKKCSLSPAQYWKVSKTSNLVNKSGKWQFSSLKWSLPEENCEGPITDNASGKILDIVDQESLVELVDIEDASLLSNGQKWIKAKQNKDGWFMPTCGLLPNKGRRSEPALRLNRSPDVRQINASPPVFRRKLANEDRG